MTEGKDFLSNNILELKIENGNSVSFNGQSISFRLSIKVGWFVFAMDKGQKHW